MTVSQPVPVQPGAGREESEAVASERVTGGQLVDDVDRLLDEIDAVLEEQAVLVNYLQRSGQ
jgi:hypothetical protein